MKYLLLILFLIPAFAASGQQVSGIVTDKATNQAVSGAMISIGNSKTMTNQTGRFEIALAHGDSIKVVHFAYKTYIAAIRKTQTLILVQLEPKVTALNEVTVHATRDFKQDSIANRLNFAKQFNYTGPKVMDAFTGNSDNRQPFELISVNPLLLVAALTKKSSPEYKFKQKLIGDEHEQYVDEKFNRGIVSTITGLQGDTLSTFLVSYRPTYEFAVKATVYDMEVYIREKFKLFEMDGVRGANPFRDVSDKNSDPAKAN